jgi:uncharacterized protein (TIGR02594 family)
LFFLLSGAKIFTLESGIQIMVDPSWVVEGRRHIGLAEIVGPKHNNVIVSWLDKLNAWWRDDETPWCGVFVAHCIKTANCPLPRFWMRAKDWLNWGTKLDYPMPGCVVVFSRDGGGHVGFVVGQDERGNLMVLGGNQGNAVNIRPFSMSRVVGFRWPPGRQMNSGALPLMISGGKLSANES